MRLTIDQDAIYPSQNEFSVDLAPSDRYLLTHIDGLDSPDVNLKTVELFGQNGGIVTGQYVGTRTVVMTMALLPPVAANRQYLYNLAIGGKVTCHYDNNYRAVYFTGYVKSVTCNQFANPQIAQITIECPSPYLYAEDTTIYEDLACNEYYEIYNDGDVDAICKFSITANKQFDYLRIENNSTNGEFTVDKRLFEGYKLEISSDPENRYVNMLANGTVYPVISDVSIYYRDWPMISTKKSLMLDDTWRAYNNLKITTSIGMQNDATIRLEVIERFVGV